MKNLDQYFELVQERPSLFANPQGTVFTILLDQAEISQVEAYMQQKLIDQGIPQAWAREWSQVGIAFRDQYLMLLRDAVRFPDGSVGTYIRFVDPRDGAPGVIVLPICRGQILLLRHFRHATRTWHLEIPRGFGWPGLTSEESASKELEEEIGATPSRLIYLGQTYPNTGMTSERDELFYAEIESYGSAEAQEAIVEILPTPQLEFERMLRDNEITDGFTLAAYARAKLKGLL